MKNESDATGARIAPQAAVMSAADVAVAMERLGADADMVAKVTSARERLESARPALRADILRFHRDIVAGLGDLHSRTPRRVRTRPEDGEPGAFANVLGFLTGLPELEAYYRSRRLDEALMWETLADLPRHIARHAQLKGQEGMDDVRWLGLHFRGLLFAFGRLQIQRARACTLPWDEVALRRARGPLGTDGIVYNLHIPAGGGMSSERVDASLMAGNATLRDAFPEERPVAVTCVSWLMDPQLARVLPADSNIIRFFHRFRIVGLGLPTNRSTIEFVFGRPGRTPIDELPQDTTLQRTIVDRIRAGKKWRVRTGWFPISELPRVADG